MTVLPPDRWDYTDKIESKLEVIPTISYYEYTIRITVVRGLNKKHASSD